MKLEDNVLDFKKNDENQNNVKNAIKILVQAKYSNKAFQPDKQALLEKMQRLQKSLPGQKEELGEEMEKLLEELDKYEGVEVVVLNKVYPGVKVNIQNQKYAVDEERTYVKFKLVDKEVVCGKYK